MPPTDRQRTLGGGRRAVPAAGGTLPLGRRPSAAQLQRTAAALAFALALGGGAERAAAQDDAYRDPVARHLIEAGRAARGRTLEGLRSYEGLLRERVYVGLGGRRFSRERGVFEQERVARIRWEADGDQTVQWLGARRAVPLAGLDTRLDPESPNDGSDELRSGLPSDLLTASDIPGVLLDPRSERMTFGDDWALHPLSDTAEAHYRYAAGDTLTLTLPDRTLSLYEVRVEPRRSDFHLVAGSLWFDGESGALVRATYKPARPYDLLLDEPEDAEDVPGFLRPIEAEFEYITVEYSFHEFQYWLPRRFALSGEARLGGLVRIPMTIEWEMREYDVDREESLIPLVGPLPSGWSRREERVELENGSRRYVTVLVPPADSLVRSPTLSTEFGRREPTAFSDDEIDELVTELESLLPGSSGSAPHFAWGLERGLLRYNTVEGLSAGVGVVVPVSSQAGVEASVRIGSGDQEPYGELALVMGPDARRWRVEGYRRLRSMNDWSNPFSLTASLGALVTGGDKGEYFRTTGAAAGLARRSRSTAGRAELFVEAHDPVTRTTDFFLLDPVRDRDFDPLVQAEELTVRGFRGTLEWFRGIDPAGLVLTGDLGGEAGWRGGSYQRTHATVSARHPLALGFAGAAEVGGGTSFGAVPVQRRFFLGGTRTVRGYGTNDFVGDAFWRGRAELARGLVAARILAFGDVAWIGDRSEVELDPSAASVGVGVSLLDGLLRADLARSLLGRERWKVHLYLDALF